VPELSEAQKAQWDNLGFDATGFLAQVDLSEPAGEKGRSVLEMVWSRPTGEANGITGGYTGDGFKTVLPAEASAKISFRLVGSQDPMAIRENFRKMVRDALPADCTVDFADHSASPAAVMSIDDPIFEDARQALTDEWPREAAFIGCGGSIPIAGDFQEILGLPSMLIGFGLDDDALHSPNEKYDLRSFHKGIRSWARVLDAVTRKS
jgi:acetylornithine deacetylase/succinyl-diaminopimelate desuccinylase-like protein